MKSALIVIDVQNDYFTGGAFPQWDAEAVAERIVERINKAKSEGQMVIAIQHISADPNAWLFRANGEGVAFYPLVAELLVHSPVVIKRYADSFFQTELGKILKENHIEQIDLCGMMTQNCITHTALSPEAEPYQVRILANYCSAPSELIHKFAVAALSARFDVLK
ncbi:MAG: isochorismatase family protein [Cardiobacteriaceae bacterium]|nr:isochorismatase family protein [Cardiobacteriaceae bacterium]